MIKLSIAQEFSETPGPRSKHEGEYSGEEFLDSLLLSRFEQALKTKEKLQVDLDGTEGYATSFLEAAFGGLCRKFDAPTVLKTIELKSDDEPRLVAEVQNYIREAKSAATHR
jgi:hypothetical protein